MDRLIWSQIDFSHKPLNSGQRLAARKAAKKSRKPRSAASYRGAKRNARSHTQRCNPSVEGKRDLPVGWNRLNRSLHWKPADDYFDARTMSPSNREVV